MIYSFEDWNKDYIEEEIITGITCDNCYELIKCKPIEHEIEIEQSNDGIISDVPVIRLFCSNECLEEFKNEGSNVLFVN